jgi:hypothetical protein
MQYMTKDELRNLFQVAYSHNQDHHHLAMVTALWHGLRVSEVVDLRETDVTPDGQIIVNRLKGSNKTTNASDVTVTRYSMRRPSWLG